MISFLFFWYIEFLLFQQTPLCHQKRHGSPLQINVFHSALTKSSSLRASPVRAPMLVHICELLLPALLTGQTFHAARFCYFRFSFYVHLVFKA